MPEPGVKFVYVFCRDLSQVRRFYTDLLGLHEVYASAEDRAVAYDCDGLQFTFFEDDQAAAPATGWARQPGWQGGDVPATSWSVSLTAEGFATAVARVRSAGLPTRTDEPEWLGYWSFVTKDPAGTTVELTHVPTEGG